MSLPLLQERRRDIIRNNSATTIRIALLDRNIEHPHILQRYFDAVPNPHDKSSHLRTYHQRPTRSRGVTRHPEETRNLRDAVTEP